MRSFLLRVVAFAGISVTVFGLDPGQGTIRGDFELQAQTYKADSVIQAPNVPEKMAAEGFLNLGYTLNNLSVGLRYEGYFNPLQGVDPRYAGSGISYRFARYSTEELDVTVGNFYEQFGSGMILRTYEERALGIDNSLDGVRVKSSPTAGLALTALFGKQRNFWAEGSGLVRGVDAEVSLNDFDLLGDDWMGHDVELRFGGSFVSRFQTASDPFLNLPENVGAWSYRGTLTSGGFLVTTEYAHKINDPSLTNNTTFNPGNGLFVTTSYSTRGFGLTLNAKRIDNMDFRSDRTAYGNSLTLNFLPPLSKQHSYRLVTMYPYATQPNGEIGFQGELVYSFAKHSLLGGQYGTEVTLNYSNIHDLDTMHISDTTQEARYTYSSKFMATGPHLLFDDLNLEISHMWSHEFKSILTLVRQTYNKNVVQGKVGYDSLLHPFIAVFEGTWQMNSSHALRFELQHLWVKEVNYSDSIPKDHGNWAYALAEYTLNSSWFLTAFDEYNYGNEDPDLRLHYPNLSVTYVHDATRIALGYGKQRAGILCVGGVCRLVPAADGFTLSITSSF